MLSSVVVVAVAVVVAVVAAVAVLSAAPSESILGLVVFPIQFNLLNYFLRLPSFGRLWSFVKRPELIVAAQSIGAN